MRVAWAVALLVLGAAGCEREDILVSEAGGTSATLRFTHEAKSDANANNYYIEGFLSYVSVTGPDVSQTEEIPWRQSVSIKVPQGGEYEIESWVRPCEANCSNLDPPEDRCAASVSVPDGAMLNVVIRSVVTEPCTIDATSG